ncbi:MAG: SMC family ATPase [Microbacterium ginsengisoli]|nr:SMC family ATPase [Microbacterium ginsengisoli]
MKLHSLELEGFGPYRERQRVDFDAFDADGLYLITGRTGAGKSSILDGVCFALFGAVPRYEAGDKRLRSDHSGPNDITEVALEFSAAGERWRIVRAPDYERPKQRGEGVTLEKARAELARWDGTGWRGVAAGPRDVGVTLAEVVGLTQAQFLQVILLAQNRFQRFLLARNDERQELLRTLFDSRSYDDLTRRLDERRKSARDALDRGADAVALVRRQAAELIAREGWGGDPVAAAAAADSDLEPADLDASDLEGALARAADRRAAIAQTAVTADAAAVAASDALADARRITDQQTERAAQRRRTAELAAAEPAIEASRTELRRALAAEALREVVEAQARALRAAELARAAAERARGAWGHDDADAPARVEVLTGDLARARDALAGETELAEIDGARESAAARAEAARERIAAIDVRAGEIPAERAILGAGIAAATADADARDARERDVADLQRRLDAARETVTFAAASQRADEDEAAAARALSAATANWSHLLDTRIAGAAGELAERLVDGEPCAVCGATSHPHPAAAPAETATPSQIDAAAAARDAAQAVAQRSSAAASDARAALAAAAARAEGGSVDDLSARLAAAADRAAAATAAVVRRDEGVAARDRLDDTERDLAAERTARATDLADADAVLAGLAARRGALVARVDAARGRHASVSLRVAADEAELAVAAAVVAAVAAQTASDVAAREASERCADALGGSPFADADAVRAAVRDAVQRDRLDARVRGHEASVATVTARRAELEALGLPEEPVDVAAAQEALRVARDAVRSATDALSRHDQAAAALSDLRDRAAAVDEGRAELERTHQIVARLADTLAGRAPNDYRMPLETYVLAAELEEIVTAANVRLDEMSSGRYRLQHTDARASHGAQSGLGLEIVDAFTAVARPAHSLSGGETFLASLALALGLAEVVTARAGGIRLDTLFIDEGFGSLDAETLDLAMRTLDELRSGGRTVGVISHVEAMKEQIPAQLVVEATGRGPSIIRQSD